MTDVRHKTWAEIDLDALSGNYTAVRDAVTRDTPDCRVMCVVKADCYGHGTELCIPHLVSLGVSDFGVSCVEEALEVRKYAPDADILILGHTPAENTRLLCENRITQTVYSYEWAKLFSDAMAKAKAQGEIPADAVLFCHIKLDTGMNRIGFGADDADCVEEVARAVSLPHLRFTGIFTHFACADETDPAFTGRQYERFSSVVDALSARGIGFSTVHCCNSAAALRYPAYHRDMIRLGIMLYGYAPFDFPCDLPLRPVMRFVTTVAHIHRVKPGESVSYGAVYHADGERVIATVAAGYADGFIRDFGKGGMIVRGQFAPVVGRVCMDQCMLDVTGIPGVAVGDEAEMFDRSGDNVRALSRLAGTIEYELLCAVSKRVNRIAVKKGK